VLGANGSKVDFFSVRGEHRRTITNGEIWIIMATYWIEIDAQAFNHNIAQYKKLLGNNYLAFVIKGNAYGHGQQLMAKLAQENPEVDWLCVANLSEAVNLRNIGITKPILVMSCVDLPLSLAATHDIDIICYDLPMLFEANAIGTQLQKPINIHIKIDTGLSRFGLMPHEALPFIQQARELPWINVNGVFTHFAQSQKEDQSYTQMQHERFANLLRELKTLNIDISYRHCANTAAVSMVNSPECNFARVGAGIYGFWPSEKVRAQAAQKVPGIEVQPLLSWKTQVTALRTLPAGTHVGYDITFTTERETKVAIVPVGYFEGFDRRASNNGKMLINGNLVPVIGRVCMNATLLDITDCPDVKIGDEVTIIGKHPELTPAAIAQRIASFNAREITTRLNPEVERKIVNNHVIS